MRGYESVVVGVTTRDLTSYPDVGVAGERRGIPAGSPVIFADGVWDKGGFVTKPVLIWNGQSWVSFYTDGVKVTSSITVRKS